MPYLLTYSTVQSPSWEANWFAVSQEIPRISRNLKVHYRTHKRPPPVSILGQPNPVHIPTSHFLWIRPNVIPWYAYLEKHNDDDDNDISNDMLRSNAWNRKTTTGIMALRTVSCAALPAYCSDTLNTFPVNFILHIFLAGILHVQYVLPTCCTMFILLLIIAPTCLGNSHIFQDLFHLKKR